MDAQVSEYLNLVFRWVHVVAGVTWIGLLYFFNWINGAVGAQLDAETKQKVLPELMPRTLYWFRWGAAYTWISGVLLLGIVYYMGGVLVTPDSGVSVGMATGIGLGSLVVGWVIYDFLWKAMAKNQPVGMIVSFVLVVGASFGLNYVFSGRAMYIHIGALFGTFMAANVWMRIWPNQRKIITAIKAGDNPPEGAPAMAGLRSKHNTYMSVPLIFIMISNHFPSTFGNELNWVILAVVIAVGWAFVKFCYNKGTSEAPAKY